MDTKLKEVLLEIVRDLADLRVNQAVLAARIELDLKTSLAAAQDAKTIAMQQQRAAYDRLREKIESL